jgi:hypothetical protein
MWSVNQKNWGTWLRTHSNCVFFSMAGSMAYVQDDVYEPSDGKIGNI